MVQWLRLHGPNAGGLGSIPGQGTRSHMLQRRVHRPQLKILDAVSRPGTVKLKKKNRSITKWEKLHIKKNQNQGIWVAVGKRVYFM